jgi:YaiO family outer membrane protein
MTKTKTKTILLACAPLALLLHGPARADSTGTGESKRQPEAGDPLLAPPPKAAPTLFKTGMSGDYVGFSDGMGFRRTVTGDVTHDLGDTTVKLGMSQGERDYGPGRESWSGLQAAAMVSHSWSDRVTTTTSVSGGSNSPVFSRFQAQQDVEYKLLPGTIVRLGGRYTRFFGGKEVGAGMAGVTQYFAGGLVSYRLSAFDVVGGGRTQAHLFSLQVKDPGGQGSTQLWAGTGSSLHELDWMDETQGGRSNSLTVRRVQPLGGGVGMALTMGRTWYDRPLGNKQATRIGFGLTYKQ